MQALVNARVLADEGFVEGRVVLVDAGRIVATPRADDPRVARAERRDLKGAFLMPGFIDCQVNGGGGVLFNDDPTLDGVRAIGAAHRRFGTTGFLPTLISDDFSVIERAMAAVRAAIEARVPGVLGIHIEGPFINAAKKGTHDASKFRGLDAEGIALLSSLGVGRTLVTLAPETTTPAMVRRLADTGVIVSAGHTDATFEQMSEAFRHGAMGVTHLYNAMSPFNHRKPGVVGAALLDPDCWCGLIVDGHHVHPAALQVALACKRPDRFMLVTDAMPNVGAAESSFMLQGKRITVKGGVCVDESGVISGSALDMASAVRNCVSLLGLPLEQAARMASTYPAEFIGMGGDLGRIAPGYRASFVVADEDVNVIDTWVEGRVAS